ncbi:MAG: ribosome maturation factor RimM [Hyphomonadaceae bacterium]|nr:ribosome maturation factor RimM [Hyphomonadaceae bacterium]
MAAKPTRILLGRIAGAHGIRGEVLIKTFTAAPETIGAYGPLSDESGTRTYSIEHARATAKGVVARMRGIADRTGAEALKGIALYIERARLPAAAEGEFYHADLIGLQAVDGGGKPVGEIVAVQNFGAGDLLEIRLAGSSRTELVSFTDQTVPEVDIAAGRVVVILPSEPEPDT